MKNLKLATKIYLVLGLALFTGAGAVGFLYYQLSATTSDYKTILSQEGHQQTQARLMQVTFKKDVTMSGQAFRAGDTFSLDATLRKSGDSWLIDNF